jgi:hypothetical protein
MAAYAKPIRPSRAARQRCIAAARVVGCTCSPEFELVRHYSDELQHLRARHDDRCPALNSGRQLVLGPVGARP